MSKHAELSRLEICKVLLTFLFVFVVKKRISDSRFLGYCRTSRAEFAKKVVQTKLKTSSLSIFLLKNNIKNESSTKMRFL